MVSTLPEQPIIRVPGSACTHEGFRAWAVSDEFPDRGRICYVDGGVLIDMTPERLESHNKIKHEIARSLGNLSREFDLGLVYPDGMLLTNEAAGISNEPDVMFATWHTLEVGRLRRVPLVNHPHDTRELEGAPDLVVEIVSPSSIDKDTRLLRDAYRRAGIPEYWLIDALGGEVGFTILRHGADRYEAVEAREGWRRSDVFGRSFRLDRDRDRLGDWRYTLAVR